MKKRASKDEVRAALEYKAKIDRQKTLARLLFPAVEQLPTVYDAQTAFNATAGYLKAGLLEQEAKLKVSDLHINISKTEDGAIKEAMSHLLEMVKDENAKEAMQLIDAMGQKLPEFIVQKHIKDPMTEVPASEYIA